MSDFLNQIREEIKDLLSNTWQDQSRKAQVENILADLEKAIPEGYALVRIEHIDGLKEAILNCAKKKNAAIRSSLGAGSLPEKCRVEVDDLTVVLECARSYLKLQEKNDE